MDFRNAHLLELEVYLKEKIPMSAALGLKIVKADDNEVEVFAPLFPNRNHLGTAFGGSLNSILLLTCYSWLFRTLKQKGYDDHIVLKSSQIRYYHPVNRDIRAICRAPSQQELHKFMQAFEKKGRARIELTASVQLDTRVACELTGEFVTLGGKV